MSTALKPISSVRLIVSVGAKSAEIAVQGHAATALVHGLQWSRVGSVRDVYQSIRRALADDFRSEGES